MHKVDLHERFIECLKGRFPKRSELVHYISEVLRIEKEPASRRLSDRVKFSVEEIGILAEKLGISLDALLYNDSAKHVIPLEMNHPKSLQSFDLMVGLLEQSVQELRELSRFPADVGAVFDSLPLEFFVAYPALCKFLYFKWGHFFVKTAEFKNYAHWQIPPKMELKHRELIDVYRNFRSAVYIWDASTIWNVVNDIRYFRQLDILKKEDIGQIKSDLHQMLEDVEGVASGERNSPIALENTEFYVSSINIGMTVTYIMSDKKSMGFFKTFFVHSYLADNRNFCLRTQSWLNAMKRVSTLISGSGEKERILFFKEQHRIVDVLL